MTTSAKADKPHTERFCEKYSGYRMRHLLITLTLLALTITPTIAQSDEAETWEIIERCVGEPVEPPADWSFEGIIFLQNLGIYGLSDTQQPYLISASQVQTGVGNFVYSGTLSPDGIWFAVPSGEVEQASLTENSYLVTEIHVYGTANNEVVYKIKWESWYWGYDASILPIIQWNTEETILFSDGMDIYEINPFTGQMLLYDDEYVEQFPIPLAVDRIPYRYPNQDRQHRIYHENGYLKVDGLSLLEFTMFNEYDYWSADWTETTSTFYIIAHNQLYIGDTHSRNLSNTCLTTSGAAWSPNAELAVSNGEYISIINFEDNTNYIAAYHQGSVFDWRIPPEEN